MRGTIILILLLILPITAVAAVIQAMSNMQEYEVVIGPDYRAFSGTNSVRYNYWNGTEVVTMYLGDDFVYDANNSVWYILMPAPADFQKEKWSYLLIPWYRFDNLTQVDSGVIRIKYTLVFDSNKTQTIHVGLFFLNFLYGWGWYMTDLGVINVNNTDRVSGEIVWKFDRIKILQFYQKYKSATGRDPYIVAIIFEPEDENVKTFPNTYIELSITIERPKSINVFWWKTALYGALGLLYTIAGVLISPGVNIFVGGSRRRAMTRSSGAGIGFLLGVATILLLAILSQLGQIQASITDVWGYTKYIDLKTLLFPLEIYTVPIPSLIGIAMGVLMIADMLARLHKKGRRRLKGFKALLPLVAAGIAYVVGAYIDQYISFTSDIVTLLFSGYWLVGGIALVGYLSVVSIALWNAAKSGKLIR